MRNKTKCGLRIAHLCIWPKTVLSASVGEKLGFFKKKRFWWEIIPISGFQVIKEEEGSKGKEFQEIQGMNLNSRKFYLMFGLEIPNSSKGFAHGWFRMIIGCYWE